jgi:hypothetical protein
MIGETAQIIQFSAIRPKLAKVERPKISGLHAPIIRDGEGLTETAKNSRLRSDRHDVWREADTAMDYWRVSMKMHSAIACAQRHGLPEGDQHAPTEHGEFNRLCAKWRQAWSRLMLTPAPDMLSVTWKRAQLKAENYKYTELTAVRIERAIADDVEFLKAHPTRRSLGSNSDA